MKYATLIFLAILAVIFIFLVLALNADKRWFQEFSQSTGNTSSDSFQHAKQSLTLSDVLKSTCFWDKAGESGIIGGLNSCYKFLPDGQCFFYYYTFYDKKRTDSVYRFEDIDIIVPTKWSTAGDTLLIARGTHYKVLSFGRDSVIVKGYLKDTMVFRKNCQTFLER